MFKSVRQILNSEVELGLWRINVNGFPIWSLFRNSIFINYWTYYENHGFGLKKKKRNTNFLNRLIKKLKEFRFLFRNFFFTLNIIFRKNKFSDIFILNKKNIIEDKHGNYIDKLYHNFILKSKNPMIIYKGEQNYKNYYGIKLVNFELISFLCSIKRYFYKINDDEIRLINDLYNEINKSIIFEKKYLNTQNEMIKIYSYYKILGLSIKIFL